MVFISLFLQRRKGKLFEWARINSDGLAIPLKKLLVQELHIVTLLAVKVIPLGCTSGMSVEGQTLMGFDGSDPNTSRR